MHVSDDSNTSINVDKPLVTRHLRVLLLQHTVHQFLPRCNVTYQALRVDHDELF